uniref:Uncharacterized protein n=1 Tax=Anguilla anguilla TaxID=7936 RepID=A0A0E9W010_ANGAN
MSRTTVHSPSHGPLF